MNRPLRSLGLVALLVLAVPVAARAAEFLSLSEPGVMYDVPSDKGKRLFVVQRYTPVEVVVRMEGWVKVRDMDGSIAWIAKSQLSPTRMLATTGLAQIRNGAHGTAPVVFQADRGVALEYQDGAPPGWARVRHRDGQEGYVQIEQVWGL